MHALCLHGTQLAVLAYKDQCVILCYTWEPQAEVVCHTSAWALAIFDWSGHPGQDVKVFLIYCIG